MSQGLAQGPFAVPPPTRGSNPYGLNALTSWLPSTEHLYSASLRCPLGGAPSPALAKENSV